MDLVAERFTPRVTALPHVDRVVDLLPMLRERADEDSWSQDRHFSQGGHRLWFEAIREPVQELVSAPPEASVLRAQSAGQ
jgi:hypothetical protein